MQTNLTSADGARVIRRIDWRFLLPSPDLGRVLCVSSDSMTAAAIRSIAADPVVVESWMLDRDTAPFSLIVTTAFEGTTAHLAHEWLEPGGYLFAELPGGMLARRMARRHIQQAGLQLEARLWHWPSFVACEQIVDADDPAALMAALRRQHGSARTLLKKRIGQVLVRLGQFGTFAPDVSVLAFRPVRRD